MYRVLIAAALLALAAGSGTLEARNLEMEAGSSDPASPHSSAAEVRWETRLDRARIAALKTNQPLLIEFWAVWCENCREMDRDVYADERVAAAMAKVIPVRVDIDRNPEIARKYAVSGTPTLVLADSYGNPLFRYTGALPRDRMMQLLQALPGDVGTVNRLSAALARDKEDAAALAALGSELRAAGFFVQSNEYYARALRTREGRSRTPARAEWLLAVGKNALELRLVDEAARSFEQVRREFPGTSAAAEAARLLSTLR